MHVDVKCCEFLRLVIPEYPGLRRQRLGIWNGLWNGEVGTLVKHSAVLYLSLVNTGEKDNQTMAAKKTDPRVF